MPCILFRESQCGGELGQLVSTITYLCRDCVLPNLSRKSRDQSTRFPRDVIRRLPLRTPARPYASVAIHILCSPAVSTPAHIGPYPLQTIQHQYPRAFPFPMIQYRGVTHPDSSLRIHFGRGGRDWVTRQIERCALSIDFPKRRSQQLSDATYNKGSLPSMNCFSRIPSMSRTMHIC